MRLSIAISIIVYLVNTLVAAYAINARSADREALDEALSQSLKLHSRALDIKNGGNPDKDIICPKTNKYDAQTYTMGQIKAAYRLSVSLEANSKQIGDNEYPHRYRGAQELPNDCGTNTHEFVIMTDHTKYDGGSVEKQPGRILYELKVLKNSNGLWVRYCAVIRHVNDNFEHCAKIEKP